MTDVIQADDILAARDEAATFVLSTLAQTLGVDDWTIHDGSEEWEGDVSATLYHILVDAKVIDDEDGSIARHRTNHTMPNSVVEAEPIAWAYDRTDHPLESKNGLALSYDDPTPSMLDGDTGITNIRPLYALATLSQQPQAEGLLRRCLQVLPEGKSKLRDDIQTHLKEQTDEQG